VRMRMGRRGGGRVLRILGRGGDFASFSYVSSVTRHPLRSETHRVMRHFCTKTPKYRSTAGASF
jgi:hypothetical protein